MTFRALRHDVEMTVVPDGAFAGQTLTLVVTIAIPSGVAARGDMRIRVPSADVGGPEQTGACSVRDGPAPSTSRCILRIPEIAAGRHEVIGTWSNNDSIIAIGYRRPLEIATPPTASPNTGLPAGRGGRLVVGLDRRSEFPCNCGGRTGRKLTDARALTATVPTPLKRPAAGHDCRPRSCSATIAALLVLRCRGVLGQR